MCFICTAGVALSGPLGRSKNILIKREAFETNLTEEKKNEITSYND